MVSKPWNPTMFINNLKTAIFGPPKKKPTSSQNVSKPNAQDHKHIIPASPPLAGDLTKSDSGSSADSGGAGGDGDGGGYVDYGDGGGYAGGYGGTGQQSNFSTMSEAEKQALFKMKDSNVPYYYKKDENDLLNLAASQKKNEAWGFKEELFIYTTHDKKKHRYITSVQIDSDKDDIVTTCQIEMPYDNKLME